MNFRRKRRIPIVFPEKVVYNGGAGYLREEPVLWNCAAAAARINRQTVYSADIIIGKVCVDKEKESRDSMYEYQFLGGFPTANLTSNKGGDQRGHPRDLPHNYAYTIE